jgi:hypothetical protein
MTVLNSRPSIVRTSGMFKLYFYCPEKMSHIKNMCENTNYEDMTLTFEDVSIPNHSVEKKIKFGEGWMGRDAGIVCALDYYENPKGIYVLVELPYDIEINNCRLESPEDTVQLGGVTEFVDDWTKGSVALSDFQEWQLQYKAAWENYTEEEKKAKREEDDNNWFMDMKHLEENGPEVDTPVRIGMKDVLLAKEA